MTPAQQAAADKARAAAIAAIRKDVPGLANPENYVTSANKPNIAEARKAFISTNLGLDPALFKSGANYNIALANKAGAIKNLGLDYTKFAKSGYDIAQANEASRFKNLGVSNVESLVDAKTGKFNVASGEERLIRDVYKLDPATFLESGRKQVGTRINPRPLVWARRWIIGTPKAMVLPVPVWAMPRTSLPVRATGMASAWIGVAVV